MRNHRRPPLPLRAIVVAVATALALLATGSAARAAEADPAVLELVRPTNVIEAGAIFVDNDSAKFGEYNGLDHRGFYPLLNFDVRGGAGYDQESGSTERWRAYGHDVGLDVRSLGLEYGRQSRYRLRLEYDEIERNFSDSYGSLWRGVGSSTLVLPAGYPAAGARTSTAGLANWNNIQTPNLNATTAGGGPGIVIPALTERVDIGTKRKRGTLGGDFALTEHWTVGTNVRKESKAGTKLTGTAFGGFRGALLAEPIDSDITIVESSARFAAPNMHFGLGYNVSLYRNHVDAWTAENPFANNVVLNNQALMNGAPDNSARQWTLDGSYRFTPATKLVLAGSHTTMKQNEPFHFQSDAGWSVPGASSESKEIQTNFLARLNARPMKDLDVNVAYKLDHRDNRSPVRTYLFNMADAPGTPGAGNTFNNVPLDRRQQSVSLDARYNLTPVQILTAGYEHQRIQRSADASINPVSFELNNPFASARSDEDILKLGYRRNFGEAVGAQASWQHSQRSARDYQEPEIVAPGAGANVGGFQEVPGFRQFFLNDRNRDKVRGQLDYQATEQFFVQGSLDWIHDRFPAQFGLKTTGSRVLNLDGTYAASEKLSFNGFATYEHSRTRADLYQIPAARGATAPPVIPHVSGTCAPYTTAFGLPADYLTDTCRNWSFSQFDDVWTLGTGAKSTQLMGGRLTLTGDVSFSRARTNLRFTGGTYYNNGIGQNVFIPAEDLPTITSNVLDVRLAAIYAFAKNSAFRFGWQHRRLHSSDPQFDLFGITSVQAYIGSGMTSPNYHVNAVSVSYVYTFQ